MASQYKFNPENLNYDRLENNFRKRFWKAVAYVFAALFLAFLLNILYLVLFDSPLERMMRNENELLKEQYQSLLERKGTVDTVFEEIRQADENIFRMIFETEPAVSVFNEYNTINYTRLKSMNDRQIVYQSAHVLDSLLDKTKHEKLDYDILRIKSEDKAEMLLNIPAIQPIENADLTRTASGYGYRMHPIYKIRKLHSGMDYTAPVGTPVFVTGAGVVEEAVKSGRGSGNRVIINHGYGFKTVYEHLEDINVRQGRNVVRGDIIGTVGNTGLSSGPHLHYEVLFNDKAVNPVNFYFLELSPAQYDLMITLSKNSGQSFD